MLKARAEGVLDCVEGFARRLINFKTRENETKRAPLGVKVSAKKYGTRGRGAGEDTSQR